MKLLNQLFKTQPAIKTPTRGQFFHYYTSPFLWIEYLSKFGFVTKSYDNLLPIETFQVSISNNYFQVNYEEFKENSNSYYKIINYLYKGPNLFLLIFIILLISNLLFAFSFYFYKLNFYK